MRLRLAGAVLGFLAIFALAPAGASAAELHVFSSSFGSGELSLVEHSGVAVNNETGNVYVADTGNGRVAEYTAAGIFVRGFGALSSPTFIAIDNSAGPSKGDIYVATSDSKVHKFDAEGNVVGGWASSGILTPPGTPIAGLAVDSGGALDVAIAGPGGQVAKYDQAGTVLAEVHVHDEKGDPVGIGLLGLAVSSAGNIYLGRTGGAIIGATPSGETPSVAIETPTPNGLATSGTEVYLSNPQSVVRRSGSIAAPATERPIERFATETPRQNAGLAVATSGTVYVAESSKGEIDSFAEVELPVGETGKPTDVLAQSATFNGTVSADGGPPASCSFHFIPEAQFTGEDALLSGLSVPCEPAGPFSGSATQQVTGHVAGLTPETRYAVQIVPTNANGLNQNAEVILGADFETGPAVAVKAEPATNLTRTAATLNGTVNPEDNQTEECTFEYATAAAGFAAATKVPCAETPGQIGNGETPVPVHVDIGGLSEGTPYVFRLSAKTTLGGAPPSSAASFETHGTPLLGETQAGEVTETTTTIRAKVNPRGEPSTLEVEYVTAAQFEAGEYAGATVVPVPAQELGSGVGFLAATQVLSGLSPGTAYRFRVIAQNPAGPAAIRPEGSFTTFGPAGPLLPDDRAYELVSPAQKNGEVIPLERAESGFNLLGGDYFTTENVPGGAINPSLMQSTPDGNSIAYLGQAFHPGLAPGGNEYLTSRGSSGWGPSAALSKPTFERGLSGRYVDASADLTRFIVYQNEAYLPLSPSAPTVAGKAFNNLYLRTGSSDAYEPFVKEAPKHRSPHDFTALFAGANEGDSQVAPLSHAIFSANDALPGAAPAAPTIEPGSECKNLEQNCNLYEWTGGQLRLVNVLPNGTAASFAEFGGGVPSGSFVAAYDHAISADGSHIFWSAGGKVYVRIDGERTEEIKDSVAGSSYLTASRDGTKVLLGDGCLYELAKAKCVRLTPTTKGGFEGILGAAEDLSRIYFVDSADLGGENAQEESPVEGKDNLYAWVEGERSFIGTLAAADNDMTPLSHLGDWKPSASYRPAQVTPDGRFLAFMSSAALIKPKYDNTRADGEKCLHGPNLQECYEVFEYDAATAALKCVSCNPSGSRPLDGSNLNLPTPLNQKYVTPPPDNLTASGRLFFESRDALSPADRNGTIQDLYEWEPAGVGSCANPQGCLALISSGEGTRAEEPHFVNASSNGDDVFFATRRRLVANDTDSFMDLYDARVGGGFPVSPTVSCDEGAVPCKGAAGTPPAQPTPGSGAPAPGNPKPKSCKKGFARKGGKCVKKPKHHKEKGGKQKQPAHHKKKGGSK